MNNNHWYSGLPAVQARPNAQRWYLELQRVKREYKVLSENSEIEIKKHSEIEKELAIAIKTIAEQKQALDDKTAELEVKKEELNKVRLEIKEAREVLESSIVSENEAAYQNENYEEISDNLPEINEQEFLCKKLKVMLHNDPSIVALFKKDKIKRKAEYCNSEDEGGLFDCYLCEKSFSELKLLKKHLSHVHEKIKKFKCLYCEKKFKKLQVKKFHEKDHCPGPKVKRKMEKISGSVFKCVPTLVEQFTIPKKLTEWELEHIKSLISSHSKLDGLAPCEVEELFVKEMGRQLNYKWIEELENCNFIEQKIFLKPT
jgi:DNA repair exonuclease SbcCD ATPase subunit